MTRNARRRRRCGARIEMRERAPSVDIHVHVRAEVLGELANAEICAAAGDRGGEIEPAFHERVALACADDVRGAADGNRFDEVSITQILKDCPVKVGGGKSQVKLFDLMPNMCVQDFLKIAEDYADDL